MNTLREAVGEYLEMRRGLGFKLQEAGKGLINFITFLEQHNASYITQELVDQFHHVSGAAQRLLHHSGVGAGLGSTTVRRSAGAFGSTAEFRPRIRTLSQCH